VIDYDRILVLDQGRVAEYGTPWELLQAKGIFDSMCKESGEYNDLVYIAKSVYLGKKL
jgi:ABC-type multidrug transport system fused ATPase/permease subunit